MGEGNFCEPNWKPNSTINQFMDGLEYGLAAPFMDETMEAYSKRRTAERQKDWQKEKETCEEVDRAVQRALAMALIEEIQARTRLITAGKDTGRRWEPRRNSYGNADPRDFKGLKPDPQQEKKEEDFFKIYE